MPRRVRSPPTTIAALLALALSTLALAACADAARDEPRAPYVQANLALLRAIPAIPRATLVATSSSAYRERERDDAPVAGYGTTRLYRLPRGTDAASAVGFYRRALARRWAEVARSGEYVSLRRGDAYLHILAGRGRVSVEVDHDCYKGDRAPHCFGP